LDRIALFIGCFVDVQLDAYFRTYSVNFVKFTESEILEWTNL